MPLNAGLGPHRNADCLIMAAELLTYSDESGTEPDQGWCVMAGFAANPQTWRQHEALWTALLREHGVSEFHTHAYLARDEFGQRIGEYAGWSDAKAEQFIGRLVGMLTSPAMLPIGAAVHHSAFAALTTGERRFLTGGRLRRNGSWKRNGAPERPYFFSMLAMIGDVLQQMKDMTDVRIDFFFDDHTVMRDHAIKTYHDLEQNLREDLDPVVAGCADKMGFIGFGSSAKLPRLQAADMIAHTWQGDLMGDTNRERAAMFQGIGRHHMLNAYGAKELSEYLDALGVDKRRVLQESA